MEEVTFKQGDYVRVAKAGKREPWIPGMEELIGLYGEIEKVSREWTDAVARVQLDKGSSPWWIPLESLEHAQRAIIFDPPVPVDCMNCEFVKPGQERKPGESCLKLTAEVAPFDAPMCLYFSPKLKEKAGESC